MSKTEHGTEDVDESSVPYSNLYIYYIQGHIKPVNEPLSSDFIGNWEEDDFSFLFFSKPSYGKVETLLISQPELTLCDQFQMTYEEWHGGKIVPFQVGSFFISPPWERNLELGTGKSELEILLDPGVVFGTGSHPTTYHCLEMLEAVWRKEKIESVLDLGAGTGLLALAAARLGCLRVFAVDFNFLAAKTARKNVVLNCLEDRILAVHGRAEDFMDYPADIVIANIHYDVMKRLIASEGFLHKKWFILSGLLRSEARDIAWRLSQYPVKILKEQERDGVWHTFFGSVS